MKIKNIFVYIFLFLLTALVLDLANPLFDKPSRDGGFFLYAGGQILDGKIPYQDFWDSKGPAIFYINALGLWLGNGSRWGVWFLEFIFIFGTFLVLYKTLSKQWNSNSALFGITITSLGLKTVLGYGNYTEEYALLFNALGLFIFFSILDGEENKWKYFWAGTLFGLSFTFRANNIGGLIGILLSVVLFFILKKDFNKILKILSFSLSGFIVPQLIWALYFSVFGNAWEMIYASLLFNFSYSSASDRGLFFLFQGFGKYGMGWISWLTLLAWILFAVRNIYNYKKMSLPEYFLLIWFPIEILISNISGRNFGHYYISWALCVAVFCTFLFEELIKKFKWSNYIIPILVAILLGLNLPTTLSRYIELFSHIKNNKESFVYIDSLSDYVINNTSPEDLVLTWYPDLRINFTAERTSPVKYVYYPLFYEGTLPEEFEESYIQDLITKRPEMILDCSRQIDELPSMHNVTRKEQFATPGLRGGMYIQPRYGEIFDFVKENYHIETNIDSCIIFRLN